MSKDVCEMLTSLLDGIYGNWLDTISSTQGYFIYLIQLLKSCSVLKARFLGCLISSVTGKTREEIEEFMNTGVYQVESLKGKGWITNIMYEDEVQISA